MIEDTQVFCRNSAIEGVAVDRAAVLANAEKQLYFGVNRVGARIWALLEQPRTVSALVQTLASEFAVDEVICRRDTEEFLRHLMAKNLVAVRS